MTTMSYVAIATIVLWGVAYTYFMVKQNKK